MKCIFSLLVAFALLSIPLAAADADAPKAVLGDVTGDGLITAEDALLALQAATGKIDLTKEQKALAEVDGSRFHSSAYQGIRTSPDLPLLESTAKASLNPLDSERLCCCGFTTLCHSEGNARRIYTATF